MLKITTRVKAGVVILELEGKLAGLWVKELEQSWRTAGSTQQNYPLRVDLSSVTFIDQEGKGPPQKDVPGRSQAGDDRLFEQVYCGRHNAV